MHFGSSGKIRFGFGCRLSLYKLESYTKEFLFGKKLLWMFLGPSLESIPLLPSLWQHGGKAAFGLNDIALESIWVILECQILGAVGPMLAEGVFSPSCILWHLSQHKELLEAGRIDWVDRLWILGQFTRKVLDSPLVLKRVRVFLVGRRQEASQKQLVKSENAVDAFF